MVTLNQSIEIEQNYVTLILTVLLFILKLKIFMKTFDKIISYPYGSSVFKVCGSEMMTVREFFC